MALVASLSATCLPAGHFFVRLLPHIMPMLMPIPINANADTEKPASQFRQKENLPLLSLLPPTRLPVLADYSELMHMEIPTEVPTHQSFKTAPDDAMPFIIPSNHWVNGVYGTPPGLRSLSGTVQLRLHSQTSGPPAPPRPPKTPQC